MKLMERISRWLMTDSRFEGLSEVECEAVFEALLATIFADGHVTPEEWQVVEAEIERIPWAWDHDEKTVDRVIDAARAKVVAEPGRIDDGSFAQDVAARLPGQKLREHTYHLMLAAAHVHGLDKAEVAHLEGFRKAFGISEETARRIDDEATQGWLFS